MTAYELKQKHLEHNPTSHFFDKDWLNFFGESLSTMKVSRGLCEVTDYNGDKHQAYQLVSLQKNHPSGPTKQLFYFDSTNYKRILVD